MLTTLHAHDAFYLLIHSFSMPKLLFTLRSAPCFAYDLLGQYDSVIQASVMSLLNIDLNASSFALKQAALPVSVGGLGIRMAMDSALPAFLSSVMVQIVL
jgi:hypothetical protein